MLPSTPETSVTTIQRVFPGRPDQIGEVRRLIRDHLAERPNGYDVAVVASELATNAITHTESGSGPNGTFTITVYSDGDMTRLEVQDQGGPAGFAPPSPAPEGGRGLDIVEGLATAWGIDGDAAGRTVWAELRP